MSNQEFRELVRRMRSAQKAFFKAPRQSQQRKEYLEMSRMFEKAVDNELTNPTGPKQNSIGFE